jgi:hypothetical protein
VDYLFITVVERELDNFNVTMPASLALYEKPVFGGEPASEHVVDLTWHTSESFGQVLSPEGYLPYFVFFQKLGYIFLYDLGKT